jgi:hypothetical protein
MKDMDNEFNEALDRSIRENMEKSLISINMSQNLKESIKKETIYKEKSLFKKISIFMNRTVEIPTSLIAAVCITVVIGLSSSFIITDKMKDDKSIQGYSNIKVLQDMGSTIIISNANIGDDSDENWN